MKRTALRRLLAPSALTALALGAPTAANGASFDFSTGSTRADFITYETMESVCAKFASGGALLGCTDATVKTVGEYCYLATFLTASKLKPPTDIDVPSPDDIKAVGEMPECPSTEAEAADDAESPPVDTDGDGILDKDEVDTDGDNTPDENESGDDDNDGVPNRLESSKEDLDGDGIVDQQDDDDDGDKTLTRQEIGDKDSDGIPDARESNTADTDGDGKKDHEDDDDDGDGIPTSEEPSTRSPRSGAGPAHLDANWPRAYKELPRAVSVTNENSVGSFSISQPAILVGTADFLSARAEEEVRMWLMQNFGEDLCEGDDESDRLQAQNLFPETCEYLVGQANLYFLAVGTSALQAAIQEDLSTLPRQVGAEGVRLSGIWLDKDLDQVADDIAALQKEIEVRKEKPDETHTDSQEITDTRTRLAAALEKYGEELGYSGKGDDALSKKLKPGSGRKQTTTPLETLDGKLEGLTEKIVGKIGEEELEVIRDLSTFMAVGGRVVELTVEGDSSLEALSAWAGSEPPAAYDYLGLSQAPASTVLYLASSALAVFPWGDSAIGSLLENNENSAKAFASYGALALGVNFQDSDLNDLLQTPLTAGSLDFTRAQEFFDALSDLRGVGAQVVALKDAAVNILLPTGEGALSVSDEQALAAYAALAQSAADLLQGAIGVGQDLAFPDGCASASQSACDAMGKAATILDAVGEAAEGLGAGNAGQVIFAATDLLTATGILDADSDAYTHTLRAAAFAAGMADAETPEQAKDAIDAIVSPAGGYARKREGFDKGYDRRFYGSLVNSYVGTGAGWDGTTPDLPASAENVSFAVWPTANLGPELGIRTGGCAKLHSWIGDDGSKGCGSIGLQAQVLDLGAVVTWREADTATADSTATETTEVELPDLSVTQVFSPGLNLVYGLPSAPFTVGFGYAIGPELREITTTDADGSTELTIKNAHRFGGFIAVDLVLLP